MNFDKYAKEWDDEERINRAKIISEKIEKTIPMNKDYSVMEFGCGTGLISFNLQDKFGKITLVDSSEGMIEVLNSKIDKYKVNNMTAKKIDIFNEPIEEKFDVIYSSMALHHVKDTKGIVEIFYKLLNDNGYLCIVDLDKEDGSFHKREENFNGHNGFDQKNLKELLVASKFKDVYSETFFKDTKNIWGKDVDYSLFIVRAKK
ncbi:SAM-dependent methyltransferase [Clostridium acetobutylicum]|nr:SAM-dependent methyltransferase [Clostridium acetobutylicum]